MTEAKHTPGPWRYDWDDNGAYYIDVDGRPSPCIAVISYDGEIAEANARLIAAAPDLLAALKWAMDYISLHEDRNDKHAFCVNNCLHKQARAAIARAEGRGGQP